MANVDGPEPKSVLPSKLFCAKCATTFDRDEVLSWKRDWIPKTLLKGNGCWAGDVNIICVVCTSSVSEQFHFPRTPPPTTLPAKMTCMMCAHIFTRWAVESWKGNWIYFSNKMICVKCTKSLLSPQRQIFQDETEDIELTQIF